MYKMEIRRTPKRGVPGRRGKKVIPPLSPGKLFGYTVSASPASRMRSLNVAIRHSSPLTVFRRLHALATLNKRRIPKAARVILSNASKVRRKF
jgi:hypothetical protein